MDKSLLDRLEKLEHRIADNRAACHMSDEELMAYLTDYLGHEPSDDDLRRLAAEADIEDALTD